jgi:hypothetical protein
LRRKTIAAKRGSGKLRIRRNLFIVLYAVAAMAAAEATQNESLRLTATPDHPRYSDVSKTSIFPRRRMHALVACANRG